VVRLLREITSALAYAHARGVVHRDIKPANILLSEGRAVVADFGIAKAISAASRDTQRVMNTSEMSTCDAGVTAPDNTDLTNVGVAVGTPAYMAPEQAVGESDADHRSDLYAVGVLAYEMLVGMLPFRGRTGHALIAAHVLEPAPSVNASRADVPPRLVALVARLLEKSPDARPQSADELLALFDETRSAA
jgi:serine/threonine-protein kinase